MRKSPVIALTLTLAVRESASGLPYRSVVFAAPGLVIFLGVLVASLVGVSCPASHRT